LNTRRKDSHSSIPSNIEPYENARRLSVLRRKRRVLIVDDESTGRSILEKVIQRIEDDIEVISFSSALQALEWLRINMVDLIITDYRMPEMNGVDFIKRVRRQQGLDPVPIMMITIVSEKQVRYEALEAGATAFLNRPIDQIECRTSCRNLLKMREQQSIIEDRAEWLARQVEVATQQVIVVRMAKYARIIAEELGLSQMECEDIEYAAPMHDIGKIGIPDTVLKKPGRFNDDEWVQMRQHTVIGHKILSSSQSRFIQLGAVIALNHHEKFDGTGYPNGLAGRDIPLTARIVAVADVFDALMSPRPYKRPWQLQMALLYIKEQAGSHFDPQCVDAFFGRLDQIKQVYFELQDL
jgi:two-component system response regulator RpfG